MRRLSLPLLMAAMLAAAPALADEPSEVRQSGGLLDASTHHRPMMFSLFAGIPHAYWYYAGFPFGVGARFLIPLAHDGFIPKVNDEFDIEFGVDFLGVAPRGAFYGVFAIPVELMWRFHMVDRFSLYAKLGAAIEFGVGNYYCYYGVCRNQFGVGAQPIGGVGLIFMATKTIALRLEAGYPWVKAGIGFAF